MHDIRKVFDVLPLEGPAWTMPGFLAAYTLHDGDFLGALVLESGETLLWTRLDEVWNAALPVKQAWGIFVFHTTYALRWRNGCFRMGTVAEADSTPLDARRREELMEDRALDYCGPGEHPSFDEGLTRTRLSCINSLEVEILHGRDVRVACMGTDDRIVMLGG